MTPPINIDGSKVTGITIDGTSVSEVTADGQTVFPSNTIPDPQDLYVRYDYNKATSLDALNDQTGSGRDLSGGPISGFGSHNGLQTGVYDGSTGQDMEGSSFTTSLTKPWHLFFTAQCDNENAYEYLISSPDDRWGFQIDGGNWEIYDGSDSVTGDSADEDWHVFDILYDSSGVFSVNVDGSDSGISDDGSGSAADTITGFEIGDWKDGGEDFDGQFGEALMYKTDKTSNASNIRDYLNRWI